MMHTMTRWWKSAKNRKLPKLRLLVSNRHGADYQHVIGALLSPLKRIQCNQQRGPLCEYIITQGAAIRPLQPFRPLA